jgi:hypothetical protein
MPVAAFPALDLHEICNNGISFLVISRTEHYPNLIRNSIADLRYDIVLTAPIFKELAIGRRNYSLWESPILDFVQIINKDRQYL